MPATLFNPSTRDAEWHTPLWALEVNAPAGGAATALILDTDIALCRQIGVALRSLGMQTDVCNDAADAMHRAQHGHYDVAIIDIQVCDGLKLARTLSRGPTAMPVVAFTSGGSFLNRLQARRHGCHAYVCKPAPLERFLRTVWQTCRIGHRCYHAPVEAISNAVSSA